jgi:hypothetical protein
MATTQRSGSTAASAPAYELERRLGHRSQRYTAPPEALAAGYVGRFS